MVVVQQASLDIRSILARAFSTGPERQFQDELAKNSGDVSWLLKILRSGHVRHSEEAMKSLAFVVEAKSTETLNTITQEKALPDIISYLKEDTNGSTKHRILEIISVFADTKGFAEEAVSAGVVPFLVSMMRGETTALKRQAGVVILQLLTSSAHAMEGFIFGDGLEHVVDWSMGKDKSLKILGIEILLVVSRSQTEIRALMAGEGCVQAMLAALQSGPKDCIEPALNVLLNLSQIQGIRVLMAGTSATSDLLDVASGGDDVAVGHAIGALANLSVVPKVRRALRRQGGVPTFVSLLDSEDKVIVNMAACCLANIAIESEGQAMICDAGAIPKLCDLLTSSNKHMTMLALGNLARDSSICEVVAETCGAKPFIDMLWDESDATREEAVRALANMCVHDNIRDECLEKDVPKKLVDLFVDPSPDTRRLAVLCLTVIAEHIQTCLSVFTEEAVIGIVRLLNSDDSKCVDQAALTLSWVFNGMPEVQTVALEHGVLDKLLGLITAQEDREVSVASSHSAMCLYHISQDHEETLEKIAKSGVIENLIEMVPKIEQPEARRATGHLISKLCSVPGQTMVITSQGSMARLLDMLTKEDDECREAALLSLAACAVDFNMVDCIAQCAKPVKSEIEIDVEEGSTGEIGTLSSRPWRMKSIITAKAPEDVNGGGKKRENELRTVKEWFNKANSGMPLMEAEMRMLSVMPDRVLSCFVKELGGSLGAHA